MIRALDILKKKNKNNMNNNAIKQNNNYELLNNFLNNIDYSYSNFIEEGHSNLTSEDEQCKYTFDKEVSTCKE